MRYGLMYKELKVQTSDNLTIKMWFIPAQELLPIEEIKKINQEKRPYHASNLSPKPTIIFCNGDAGNMSYNLPLAMEYMKRGFNVALFDWRGFGESDDFPLNENHLFYTEFLDDYSSVINAVSELQEVEKDKIALSGYSTGAYLSFATAFKNDKVKCIAVRGLMTNFQEVKQQLVNENVATMDELLTPPNYPQKVCPLNIASQFDKPTFIIVGENDKRTPLEMSQTVYNLIPADKELWIVKTAGHGGRQAPEVVQKEAYVNRTIQFYNKHFNSED